MTASDAGSAHTLKAFAALKPGALVGVIAPAGPTNASNRERVLPLLASYGLHGKLYPSCYLSEGYLAGPDAQRLADLHASFADDEVQAVHCLRGGYGCGRLLPGIDRELLARKAKLLIGYSDITALHAVLNGLGVPSLHAPMLTSDLVREDRAADAQALFKLLRDGLPAGELPRPALLEGAWHVAGAGDKAGPVEGLLLGGNLAIIASLIGTPWALPMRDDAILFLEDINEEPYRVDRLLCQLRHSGMLDAARGFVIGSFTHETEPASPAAVLREYLEPLGKPVLAGWPSGHGTPNRALPLGARVRLDAAAARITVLHDVIVAAR